MPTPREAAARLTHGSGQVQAATVLADAGRDVLLIADTDLKARALAHHMRAYAGLAAPGRITVVSIGEAVCGIGADVVLHTMEALVCYDAPAPVSDQRARGPAPVKPLEPGSMAWARATATNDAVRAWPRRLPGSMRVTGVSFTMPPHAVCRVEVDVAEVVPGAEVSLAVVEVREVPFVRGLKSPPPRMNLSADDVRALRHAAHPDRMTGPYALRIMALADDIEAGRLAYVTGSGYDACGGTMPDTDLKTGDLVMFRPPYHARHTLYAVRDRADDGRYIVRALDSDAAHLCERKDFCRALAQDVAEHGAGCVECIGIASDKDRLDFGHLDVPFGALDKRDRAALKLAEDGRAQWCAACGRGITACIDTALADPEFVTALERWRTEPEQFGEVVHVGDNAHVNPTFRDILGAFARRPK